MSGHAGGLSKQRQNPYKYEETNICVIRDTAEFVPELLEIMGSKHDDHEGDEKVYLDYGCGNGGTSAKYMIWHAEHTNSKLIGADVSEDMIKYASKFYKHPRVQWVHGDILSDEDWPLKELMFDGIFAIYVLMLMEDYKRALQRLYDQLKPDGKIAIMIPDDCQVFGLWKRLKENPGWANYSKEIYYPDYTMRGESASEVYKATMESIGYKILKIKSKPRCHAYKNITKMAEFFISVNPFAETLSSNLKEQLLDWYLKDLSTWTQPPLGGGVDGAETQDGDPPFFLEYKTIIITAQK